MAYGEGLFESGASNVSVRSASRDGNQCVLYDEQRKAPLCQHVNKTANVVRWLEWGRGGSDPLCPRCARAFAAAAGVQEDEEYNGGAGGGRDDAWTRFRRRAGALRAPAVALAQRYSGPVSVSTFTGAASPEQGIKTVPTAAVLAPGDADGLYVVMQHGQVWRYDVRTGKMASQPLLDVTERVRALPPLAPGMPFEDERGLLGLAFHPEYDLPISPYHRTLFASWFLIP